jgi:hypothetical protein
MEGATDMSKKIDAMLKELEEAIRQAFMNGYKQGFKDGYDESYAELLEQPQPKQSGTISVTVPVGYLCENAVGHKYFRFRKPASTYKPVALYSQPQEKQNA